MTADTSVTMSAKSSRTLAPSLPNSGTNGTAMSGVAHTSQSNGMVNS